jgi:hypothetical protein
MDRRGQKEGDKSSSSKNADCSTEEEEEGGIEERLPGWSEEEGC